jgi:UDP-glucuronate 4-epimerase
MSTTINHVLVTGGAGFIGSHLVEKLLNNDFEVTVIDNFDPFYDRKIKENNMSDFIQHPKFHFIELDILDYEIMNQKLTNKYDAIIHLAAKAGVRPSIENPMAYQEVNVKGTQNLLEFARKNKINQFVFGSSSSVYGVNKNLPWSENDGQLKPISPYAGTKVSGELLGHVYSHLYHIRFIALRFFTVFGPRQRPDLAIHAFSKKILNQQPIQFFGDGTTRRDYTFVGDIVEGIFAALHYTASSYEVINLGNHQTVSLTEMIGTLEEVLNKKAIINQMPEQAGDVPVTYADISKAQKLLQYEPKTSFKKGVEAFRNWLMREV